MRRKHVVVQISKRLHQICAHIVVILDKKDCFTPLSLGRLAAIVPFVRRSFSSLQPWKIDLDRRALAHLTVNLDVASRLLDEAIYLTEPQPCSLANPFRREKGFEGAIYHVLTHACSVVCHGDRHVLSRTDLWVGTAVFLVEKGV